MTTLLPRPAGFPRSTAQTIGDRMRSSRLLDGLTYPHGVQGYTDAFRPATGAGTTTATVTAITARTPRARSITLRPEQPLTFSPGQHILVTNQIEGSLHSRCYSLSDTPYRDDGQIEITVAHLPEGLVSSHLTGPARVGETLGLSAPQGHDFVLDGTAPGTRPDHVLLIGGGSGITPLRSMWRTMAAEGLADRVTVLYYARTADDAIFADELAGMDDAHVVLTRQDPAPTDGPLMAGRFNPDHLAALELDLATTATYVCGPPGLVDTVSGHLAEVAPTVRVRTESFAPPVAPNDPDAATGILTFAGSGKSAHNDGGTLLDQAESAGLTPKSGCRMGICHSCVTVKHAGVVRDIRTGQTDTGGECEVQLCISQAVGDVQLAL